MITHCPKCQNQNKFTEDNEPCDSCQADDEGDQPLDGDDDGSGINYRSL